MENVERWTHHSAMSDTGAHAAAIIAMPGRIDALNAIAQGLIIHTDWLGAPDW